MVSINYNFTHELCSRFIDWQALTKKGLLTGLMYSCVIGTAFSETYKGTKKTKSLENYSFADITLLADKCKSTGEVIRLKNKTVLCISGKIKMSDISWDSINTRKFDMAFVNSSSGGSVLAAIKLGRIIFDQSLPVLVSGICLSSCANYLIPASSEIRVFENSYVGFHGTPSRSEKEYLKQFQSYPPDVIEERKAFFRKNTYTEIDYFFDIGVNENYATFNYHSARKLLSQSREKCKPSNRIYYILGPKHSATYNIPVGDSWFPKSRKDFKNLIELVSQQSFVYDYDYEPFYVFGQGFTSSKKCRTSISK